jgi:hypothetical protein
MCVLVLCAFMLPFQAAFADTKGRFYTWPNQAWKDKDFHPYVEPHMDTHRAMGQYKPWQPPKGMSASQAVEAYRRADLIHKFYFDHETGLAVLEVGSNFYRLSSSDKRRFIELVDRLYAVRVSNLNVLFLKDWNTKKHIGEMTVHGLTLF